MDFLPEGISSYSEAHTEDEPVVLTELRRETGQKVLVPRMLSGHLQGRVLSFLSHLVRPSRILEIGTYTGYSAICLAEGMIDDGQLHTIDINEILATIQAKYFEKAGITDKVVCHLGDAREIIPELNQTWDLVFIDADKENYINYYDKVIDHVRPGGLIIFDNVLWSGKVTEPVEENDQETKTLGELNQAVHQDRRVVNLLLPVRDGLMILRKL